MWTLCLVDREGVAFAECSVESLLSPMLFEYEHLPECPEPTNWDAGCTCKLPPRMAAWITDRRSGEQLIEVGDSPVLMPGDSLFMTFDLAL